MKVSKNQADAVRSYLSSIGHEITHVQALEVIARGNGFRSRHVKGAKASSAVSLVMNTCKHCSNDLVRGYCKDQTCVYSDWPQVVDREDVFSLSTAALEKKYSVKKRDAANDYPVDVESMGMDLRLAFGDEGGHPLHSRGEWNKWLAARDTHPDDMSYWTWVAAKLTFGDDLDSVDHVYCLEIEAEDNEALTYTYLDAATRERRLHALLAAYTLEKGRRLTFRFYDYNPGLKECGAYARRGEIRAVVSVQGFIGYRGQMFFSPKIETVDGESTFIPVGGAKTTNFFADETPGVDDEAKPCIEMSSELFGSETFEYDSDEDRERGLMRLIAQAVMQKDDVAREYRFFEATPDTPDGGSTYGKVEAIVYGDGVVSLRGDVFKRPELSRVGEDLVFTCFERPPEEATTEKKEKLCRYNILTESEEFGTDVSSYATAKEREQGLMRLLANAVLEGDNIERRYWRYERELVAGDEVRIPAPSSVSKDKDAHGKVKSINYAARRFVVDVAGVDILFEFEMFAMMTMPFVDRITHAETMNTTREPADAVYTENCDVVLDGKHYNYPEIRFTTIKGEKHFTPKN